MVESDAKRRIQAALVSTAFAWVKLLGGKAGVAKVMKFRSFRPCPIEGPQVGRACHVTAIGADRGGIAMLDTGGHVHWVNWEEIDNHNQGESR